ncbi:MAG: adenosine deaminase [Bacteroidota bacterium]
MPSQTPAVLTNLSILPKIELHLHLDCSLSYDVVQAIDPSISEADYREHFIAPDKCTDLADYISRALRHIDLMQTPEQLRLVTLDLMDQLKADNVRYAEIRFAPLEHCRNGLTAEEVVATVYQALEIGMSKTGVQARLILCTLRHYTEEQGLEIVQLVEAFQDQLVVGFDLAADEAGFPIDAHVRAFQYAKSKGLNCTAHAGEACGPESVWETLDRLQTNRIGHGVRSIEDSKLVEHLVREGIHLEVCPTSNVQTNVVDTINDHPIDRLYQAGVSLSINTDARTVSKITLSSEYEVLARQFNWTKDHFRHCNLEAIKHASVDAATKARLREQILKAYA